MEPVTREEIAHAVFTFWTNVFRDSAEDFHNKPHSKMPEGVLLGRFKSRKPLTVQETRSFNMYERQCLYNLLIEAARIYAQSERNYFPWDVFQGTGPEQLGPGLLADIAKNLRARRASRP